MDERVAIHNVSLRVVCGENVTVPAMLAGVLFRLLTAGTTVRQIPAPVRIVPTCVLFDGVTIVSGPFVVELHPLTVAKRCYPPIAIFQIKNVLSDCDAIDG